MSKRDSYTELPVIIIGAGPVGLAAAARLVEEGRRFMVLEAGPSAGDAIRQWGHVRLFTPWKYLVDDAARRLLEAGGWTMPDSDLVPSGIALVERYLEPLAGVPAIQPHIKLGTRAVGVSRLGLDKAKTAERARAPFDVRVEAHGMPQRYLASAVIDASGTYGFPNPIGGGGVPAPGEADIAANAFYGIPNVLDGSHSRYAGKRVAVVGSGHSAFNVLLDLEDLAIRDGSEITWIVRSRDLSHLWGGDAADQLAERGALGRRMKELAESGRVRVLTGFATDEVRTRGDGIVLTAVDGRSTDPLDEIIVVTGFRPDLDLTRELRLDLDVVVEAPSALAPLIDPNVHSCGTVPPHGYKELAHPEPGFYTVGMKSYGRAPTFLLLTGYEQVRSVVKALVGDYEAAGRVELCLPETGVCSSDPAPVAAQTDDQACCAS